jgi:hypothetical protein
VAIIIGAALIAGVYLLWRIVKVQEARVRIQAANVVLD